MKCSKLILLIVLLLASCSAPAITTPTQTSLPEPTADVIAITSIPVTPDPSMGSIQGNILWSDTDVPVSTVNLELNGHSGSKPPRYTTKTDPNGFYAFVNIEPNEYGFGVYFSIPISERKCDNPEFIYDQDFGWLHYTTWLKGELWFDIIFSSMDIKVNPGETVVLDFALKCP